MKETKITSMGSSSSSNSTTELYITEDIFSEIFLHLPIDSIFKLRCVSKVWSSLLSDPCFITKWSKLNPSIWTLVLGSTLDKEHTQDNSFTRNFTFAYSHLHSEFISRHQNGFSFKFLDQNQNFNKDLNLADEELFIIGSSNGLVLITTEYYYDQRNYYVCNPVTEKWVSIPPPPPRKHDWVATGFMCTDECSSESTSYYKVIRIPFFGAGKEFKVEIFSSDLGEWSIYNVSCPPEVTWEFGSRDNLVAHNGVLYWFQDGSSKILAVSVNRNSGNGTPCNEECRLINLPDPVIESEDSEDSEDEIITQRIGESEGFICYAMIKLKERTLSVWELQEEWNLLHKDNICRDMLAEMVSMLIEGAGTVDPVKEIQVLGFSPVDKNVVILGYNKYIWAYNTRTKGYELLHHPSFLGSNLSVPHFGVLICSLKPWPTILPAVSW